MTLSSFRESTNDKIRPRLYRDRIYEKYKYRDNDYSIKILIKWLNEYKKIKN